MKQDRTHFDNQISQALAGHTMAPSPALRGALMARLAAEHSRPKAWYLQPASRWVAAALLVLLPVSIYLILHLTDSPEPDITAAPENTTAQPVIDNTQQNPATVADQHQPAREKADYQNTDIEPATTNDHVSAVPEKTTTFIRKTEESTTTANQTASASLKETNISVTPATLVSTQPVTPAKRELLLFSAMDSKYPWLFKSSDVPGALSPISSIRKPAGTRFIPDDIKPKEHFFRHNGSFSLGVSYSPEIMFNIVDNDKKFVHNASVDILFHYHDFSIRTGVGIAIAKGSSSSYVSYKPYKGSYQHLDSLNFVYDMQSEQLIAIYHTSERNIYDSISKDLINKIDKQYTYLQIPLIFGYKFYEHERFGMSVSAGPTLSLLLDTKESNSTYDPGKDLIIETTTVSADRIKTNWQFSAGLGFSYHFTPRLHVEIEPHVKYYFNSVYEKAATTRKPWSLEFRTGLLYTF